MAVPVPIQSYTLTYNPDASGMLSKEGGWPSFYSFMPDYMIGMNNYFYSFKRGNQGAKAQQGAGGSLFTHDP